MALLQMPDDVIFLLVPTPARFRDAPIKCLTASWHRPTHHVPLIDPYNQQLSRRFFCLFPALSRCRALHHVISCHFLVQIRNMPGSSCPIIFEYVNQQDNSLPMASHLQFTPLPTPLSSLLVFFPRKQHRNTCIAFKSIRHESCSLTSCSLCS